MKKKKKKTEKPILYEAFLQKKYRNCNQEDETGIGGRILTSVRNLLWLSWNLFLYVCTGITLIMLLNESTRKAFMELISP